MAVINQHKKRSTYSLHSAMKANLQAYWQEAASYQKVAYYAATLMLLSGIFHLVVLVVTGDSLSGDVSFRKPTTFGLSFGLTVATITWFLTFYTKNRTLAWLTLMPLVIASLYEVFAVTLQRWRGVPSHFNTATGFDAAIFSGMGIAVLIIALIIAIMTVWSFFPLKTTPGMAWAIRLSLLLLLVAQYFGSQIIGHATVQIVNETGLPLNIFGQAGVMKLPHFFAMHALQVLPALAWLLSFTTWAARRSLVLILTASLGYSVLLVVTALQMYSGLAPLALTNLSAFLFISGLVLLIITSTMALLALSQNTDNFTTERKYSYEHPRD